MIGDMIGIVMAMQRQEELKSYSTDELLQELVRREEITLRHKDGKDYLDVQSA